MRAPVAALLALFFATAALPRLCHAFDNELQLGADVIYAQHYAAEGGYHGGAVAIRGRLALTDAFAIAIEGGWAGHSVVDSSNSTASGYQLLQVATLGAGIHYAIDVFRWVPFVELLVGASLEHRAVDGAAALFLLDVGGGFDFMVTPAFSLGLEVIYQVAYGKDLEPVRLLFGARASWHRAL